MMYSIAPRHVASLAGVTSIRSSLMHISKIVNAETSRNTKLIGRPLMEYRDLWTIVQGHRRLQVLDEDVVSPPSTPFVRHIVSLQTRRFFADLSFLCELVAPLLNFSLFHQLIAHLLTHHSLATPFFCYKQKSFVHPCKYAIAQPTNKQETPHPRSTRFVHDHP